MIDTKKLGLSLSGGGYRAAAFHLGTLRKLHELNILQRVDVLSTISGGSITGAYYCLEKKDHDTFEKEMIDRLQAKNVIKNALLSWYFFRTLIVVLLFLAAAVYLLYTGHPGLTYIPLVVLVIVLLKLQFVLFPASKAVENAYDKFFYDKKTLQDLDPQRPLIAIGSSNIQTGRPFTFSRTRMGDSTYAYEHGKAVDVYLAGNFPIARAVTASSCVPFAFTPVTIADAFVVQAERGKHDPQLIDGGVYDNQGVHKLTVGRSEYRCDLVIVSDAGNKMFAQQYKNTVGLLVRTVDVFMARIKNFQMVQNLYTGGTLRELHIAYQSLGWNIDRSIPGFVDNMIENNVPLTTLKAQQIPDNWITNPEQYRAQLEEHLRERVQYTEIEKRNLSPSDLKIARSVSTNLTPLSKDQIRCLMTQAANITEIQVRLYLPELIDYHPETP